MRHPESGTKIILEDTQHRILCCLRDDKPDIPYPGKWDLPGGGVDEGENLLDCAYRELEEEFGLRTVRLAMIEEITSKETEGKIMGRAYGRLSARHIASIVFGSEGQRFGLFTPTEIADLDFVPQLQDYVLALNGITNRVAALEQTA